MATKPLEAYQYDVCLSFAGEDREYVSAVAQRLQASDARIFYDEYEEVDLWGKDLYEHLDHIYKDSARFCVMFVSKHYAAKLWTNHERKSAQERAFKENSEYILPARFDDTAIPGLRDTVGYIDLRRKVPEEFAQLVLDKIKRTRLANSVLKLQTGLPIKTHRDTQLGYEISFLSNWEPADGPGESTLFLKRKGKEQLSVMHVNVANFTGDTDEFFRQMKETPAAYFEKFQTRFPDAEVIEHGDTYLGSFPGYYLFVSYSISNLDISVDFVAFQVFGIHNGRIYLITCEIWAKDFQEVFTECRAMIATFNYR
ncbi:toll/interleukin-1 receptor domain-containing protein [Imhoffiella purpurea]|uniref:TIR domain-containing protein n=1 Tax=Imhoffiella purpurea TaxID=1249627 RepID=W9VGQ5_9GAMM|nr:TIR domain-containing protein [Imhoffiella purpurea]EXJ16196.1 hypothetical protein D779_0501 [Imhoffiella purpurea]